MQNKASEEQPEVTKPVTLVDAYKPILVHDQYGNPYICLNWYEATRVRTLIDSLNLAGLTEYDTGDWWIDLPAKIHLWQYQVNDLAKNSLDANNSPANPHNPALKADKDGGV